MSFNTNAQNLGAYPTQLDFKLTSGQGESRAINITNGSGKKVQFRIYLNDWVRDSMGGHIYYRADTLHNSCAKWLTLSNNFVEVEPGQAKQITVKLQMPDDPEAIKEMKWAMVFIETVEENASSKTNSTQASVRNLLRIGVHVYQIPPNLTNKSVKVIDLKPSKESNTVFNLVCQNTGDVMLECKAHLELAALSDGAKTKLDPIEFPMFPNQMRYVPFELPKNIAKGKYTVLSVVDGGEDMSLEAIESQIEVK
ncbi:MAG: hypothetical protein JST82_03165 [Bacteroidetes bacterium]|nr:hypothetical protein [Bacteroidota bacterium]